MFKKLIAKWRRWRYVCRMRRKAKAFVRKLKNEWIKEGDGFRGTAGMFLANSRSWLGLHPILWPVDHLIFRNLVIQYVQKSIGPNHLYRQEWTHGDLGWTYVADLTLPTMTREDEEVFGIRRRTP